MNLSKEQIAHMVQTMSVDERKDWVQQDVLREWIATGEHGTFEGGTGVGKSRVGILAADRELQLNPSAKIYLAVPTETLRDDDWPAEFKKWGYECLIPQITRVCWKSLVEHNPGQVDLFIGDEIHHLTANSNEFFVNNVVKKVLGLTATLPEVDGYKDDQEKFALIDSIAPKFYSISLEEGIELGIIAGYEVKTLLIELDKHCRYILGGKKGAEFMTTEASHYLFLTKQLQKATFTKNEAFKLVAMQKRMDFIYNLRSKTELAKEIMPKLIVPGKRTLLFCGSIAQSVELCGDHVYNSETDKTMLKKFQAEEIDYLGAVMALNEGKNIIRLHQMLATQVSSKTRHLIQRIGRTIRFWPGHKGLVVILVAKGTVDEKWYRSAITGLEASRIKEYNVKLLKPLSV